MKEAKLLNCPFCGGEAKMQRIINLDDFDDFFIMCEKCFSRTKKLKAERSAIHVWNTRVPMESILERLEEEKLKLKTMPVWKTIEIVKEEGGIE